MNAKRFLLTWLVVFVVTAVGNFVVHALLLNADYAQQPQLLRAEADANAHFPFMLLSFVIFSAAFVWIYAHGVEARPWVGQGLRFGLAVWLIASVARYLTYFAVEPWPGSVVAKQIGYELPLMLLLGLVAAALYRK